MPKSFRGLSILQMTVKDGCELTSRKTKKKPWKRPSSLARYSHGYLISLAITRFTHKLLLDRLVCRPDSPKINTFLENSASSISNSTLAAFLFVFQNESLSDSNDEDWSIVQTPGFGSKGATSPTTSTVSWKAMISSKILMFALYQNFIPAREISFPSIRRSQIAALKKITLWHSECGLSKWVSGGVEQVGRGQKRVVSHTPTLFGPQWLAMIVYYVFMTGQHCWVVLNTTIYYSTMMSFYHIWSRERAKYETIIHCSVPVWPV